MQKLEIFQGRTRVCSGQGTLQELHVSGKRVDSNSKIFTILNDIFHSQVLVVFYEFSLVKSVLVADFKFVQEYLTQTKVYNIFATNSRQNLHVFLEVSFCFKCSRAFFTIRSNSSLCVCLYATIASVENRPLPTESVYH